MAGQTGGRWYFGWNIVAASALLTMLTVGMRMGIGPFFLPMAQDLGFSRSMLATIVAIGMLCYGLAMPLAGYLVSRKGTRFVLLLGVAVVVLSSIWTVMARSPLNFFLAFGVASSVGLAFTSPVALTPVLSRWFTRQRGMALFFLSTGSMAGIAVMTPLFNAGIAWLGWQQTILLFAGLFALITIPLALFVIREEAPAHSDLLPESVAQAAAATVATGPDAAAEAHASSRTSTPAGASAPASTSAPAPALTLREALSTGPFWLIVLGLTACGFSMNLLGTHGVPMLMDHGYDSATSALGIGLIGVVAIFGTLVMGRLSDILPRQKLLAVIYMVRGLGFFALVMVGTHFELYLAATVGGLVWAGSIALSSAILADVYGVRLVGMLYGWAYLGHQVGAMVSSWLGGWGYERFGTHWVAFGASGMLLIGAALLSLKLPVRGRPAPRVYSTAR